MFSEVGSELVRMLTEERPGPCVSVYVEMPPGVRTHEGELRLTQLLAGAERELRATGMEPGRANEMLAPAYALLGRSVAGAGSTLALFVAPGFFSWTRGALGHTERLVVGDRFQLRPLLSSLGSPERFYVLALSLNQVRLIEATRQGSRRLPLGELETGFVAAMGFTELHSELQVHSAGASGGGAARRPAIIHGHGGGDEEGFDEDLGQWFRQIATAVADVAGDSHAIHVLATTREHVSPYAAAGHNPRLLPDAVVGNPDRLSDAELVAQARPLVEAALEAKRREAIAGWRELLGSDRATGDLGTVLRLARQGRVQTLFLPTTAELWGSYHEATDSLEIHVERRPGDEDLLGRAMIETLRGGGEVYEIGDGAALDGAPLASLLRS